MISTKSHRLSAKTVIADFPSYCAAFLKIKTKQSDLMPLVLNGVQRELWRIVQEEMQARRPVKIVILKARQLGISTFCQALLFWWVTTHKNTNALAIAHDTQSTRRIFEMSHIFYDNLPIKPMRRYASKGELTFENPKDELRSANPGLRSRLEIRTAGNIGSGRGATLHCLHCSEVSLWPDAELLTTALFPSVPHHPDTMIVLESTAHGAGDWWNDFWNESKAGATGFVPVFLPWWQMEEYRLPKIVADEIMAEQPMDSEERILKEHYHLKRSQLAWRRMKVQEHRSLDKFHQEFPSTEEEAWIVSGLPIFNREKMQKLIRMQEKGTIGFLDGKLKFTADDHGRLRVFQHPTVGHTYTIGVDVSMGLEGRDWSVICVVDDKNLDQVAVWRSRVDPVVLSGEVEKIARYYNEAMVSIEVNTHGMITQLELRKTYWNMYRWRYFDRFADKMTEKIGWETNVRTKPLIVNFAVHMVNEGRAMIVDPETLYEMRFFIDDNVGGGEAAPGKHDDCVIAWMIACYCSNVDMGAVGRSEVQVPVWQTPPSQTKSLDPRTHDIPYPFPELLREEERIPDWRIS